MTNPINYLQMDLDWLQWLLELTMSWAHQIKSQLCYHHRILSDSQFVWISRTRIRPNRTGSCWCMNCWHVSTPCPEIPNRLHRISICWWLGSKLSDQLDIPNCCWWLRCSTQLNRYFRWRLMTFDCWAINSVLVGVPSRHSADFTVKGVKFPSLTKTDTQQLVKLSVRENWATNQETVDPRSKVC